MRLAPLPLATSIKEKIGDPIQNNLGTPPPENLETSLKNSGEPTQENLEDNNTFNNTSNNTTGTTSASEDKQSMSQVQDALSFYENNFGVIKPMVLDDISDYVDILDGEMVIYAMKKAIDNQATFGYAKSIMMRWTQNKFKSMADVIADETAHRKKNEKQVIPYNRKHKGNREDVVPGWLADQEQEVENTHKQVNEQDATTIDASSVSEAALKERIRELVGGD